VQVAYEEPTSDLAERNLLTSLINRPRSRLLIDHGSSANLGDMAMLESVVRYYQTVSNLDCCVIHRPNLPRDFIVQLGVEQASQIRMELRLSADTVSRLPIVWRLAKRWAEGSPRFGLGLSALFGGSEIGISRSAAASVRGLVNDHDALHIVGGGNLTDVFPQILWEKSCLIHAFADAGKPVVLTGQQIGPFRSKTAQRALYRALRRTNFVGLREPTESVEHCLRAGLPESQFTVMGDDSFGLAPASNATARAMLDRVGLIPNGFIAANLRIAKYVTSGNVDVQAIADLLSRLSTLMECPILIVPIALNTGDSDVSTGLRLKELVGGDQVRVLNDPALDARAAKCILGMSRGAIGTSYHFCTFALSESIPTVCLHTGSYYGQKCRGLVELWGRPEIGLSLDDVRTSLVDEYAQEIATTFGNGRLQRALKEKATGFQKTWLSQMRHCAKYLNPDRLNCSGVANA